VEENLSDLPDWAKLDSWYKLVAVVGALAFLGSIPANSAPGVLIGLGLLGIGSGEWASRVRRPHQTSDGVMGLLLRVWRPAGVLLDIGGVLVLLLGLYRLLWPSGIFQVAALLKE
jgi:hypothetical protein